jgi:exopolysaccharide production protein ExoY
MNVDVKHIPLKRFFDVIFSAVAVILFSPLFLIIAIAVRLSSPGKIIYAHERIGRGGKRFRCYKFRTMYSDADLRLSEILKNNPAMRQEWESFFKLKKDPRVTPLGSFLRRTSLDEFPQFFNVLKGDLSVVGPRPCVKNEVETRLGERALKILSIRPGLTGLWQTSGRSDTSFEERLILDEHYVDNRNLLLDIKLIAKTIPAMIWPRGAY